MIRSLFILSLTVLASAGSARAEQEPSQAAVRWLAQWAEEALSKPVTIRTPNELAKERAVFCLLTLLFELHPELELASSKVREGVLQRTLRFARGERAPGEDALESWNQGFCALALIERAHRGASDGDALTALIARIQAGQRSDGGWGHGFRGSIVSYPSTLIAATNGSLLALGLFERLGLPVDEEIVERGLDLYRGVRAETGALPYGGPLHRTDFEAGRTAGALTAMTALGRVDEELLRCTADYLFVNVLSIPEGHGSPAFHIFEGGLAFYALGSEAWLRFDEAILEGVRSVLRRDGSFDDLYEHSPDTHPAMGTAELNRAYRTAFYAAAISIPDSYAAVSLREYGEDRLPVIISRHDPNSCCLVWRRKLKNAAHLFADSGIVAVVEDSGRVGFRSAASGELLKEVEHALDCDVPLEVVVVEQERDRIVVQLRESLPADFDSEELAAHVFRADEPERPRKNFLVSFLISDMSLAWNLEMEHEPRALEIANGRAITLARDGTLNGYDAETGKLVECQSALPSFVTSIIATDTSGGVAIGTDVTLRVVDAKGEEVWSRVAEANRDATPASWTAAHFGIDVLWTGSTDGFVRGLDAKSGKTISELSLRAAIRNLFTPPDQDDLLLALTDDGRVCALSNGAVAWEVDLAGGHEWRGRTKSFVEEDRLWIAHEGHGSVRAIDLKSGEIELEFALPDGSAWTVAGEQLIYAQAGRLFSLK